MKIFHNFNIFSFKVNLSVYRHREDMQIIDLLCDEQIVLTESKKLIYMCVAELGSDSVNVIAKICLWALCSLQQKAEPQSEFRKTNVFASFLFP